MAKYAKLDYAGYTAIIAPTPKGTYGCSLCELERPSCCQMCLEAGHHRHVIHYVRYSPLRTLYRACKYKVLHHF